MADIDDKADSQIETRRKQGSWLTDVACFLSESEALRIAGERHRDSNERTMTDIDELLGVTSVKPAALFARRTTDGHTLLYGVVPRDLLPRGVNDAVVVIRPELLKVADRTEEFKGRTWLDILESGGKRDD